MFMRFNPTPLLSFQIKKQEYEEKVKQRKLIIGSLPIIPWKGTIGDACAICLEPFAEAEDVKVMRCLHKYHPMCICQWLMHHIRCPVCKCSITGA